MRKVTASLEKLVFIAVLTTLAVLISVPHEFSLFGRKIVRPDLDISIGNFVINKKLDLILGLDLAGGSHLVFEADTSGVSSENKKDALDSARNIIEQRVNLFGVSEPNVQTSN